MIKLYSFGPAFGVQDPSPFVLKIDLYMRMANIEFKSIASVTNLRKASKGKLPFIQDGDKTVNDSHFIIAYLQNTYDVQLDSHLTTEQRHTAYLMGRSLDENFYWCLVYSRWVCEDTWPIVKNEFFGAMPFPLKQIVPVIARKGVKSSLDKQGFGRHSREEVLQLSRETLDALSGFLGDQEYYFGDKISTFDASAYAFLAEFICVPFDNQFNCLAREYKNLVNFCEGIESKYYKA